MANPFSVASAIVVCVAVVWSASILGGSLVRTKGGDEVIRVTGSARMPIRSDLIIWSGTVTQTAPTVAAAYAELKKSTQQVVDYLVSKKIASNEIMTDAISTRPLYESLKKGDAGGGQDTFRTIVAYELSQAVQVRSSNVDLVDGVSRQVTDLIASGVPLQSNPPRFLYTKLSDAKVEILANAAKDARRRAEEIAKSSGSSLGSVRFASMSPLQITPADSMEVAGEGQNDTSSIDKAITAIVRMGFSVK